MTFGKDPDTDIGPSQICFDPYLDQDSGQDNFSKHIVYILTKAPNMTQI